MPNCMIDDENPGQEGECAWDSEGEAGAIRSQGERIKAAALTYQAEQRAKGRELSLTDAIIELLTYKGQ